MNFIDTLALKVSKEIRINYKDAASEKVLFYALSLLINSSIAVITSLFLCSITGHFWQGVVVISCYTFVRYFSGGFHMSTSLRCCLYSIFIFSVLAHLSYSYNKYDIGVLMTIVAATILLKTAPQGIENVSRINKKYYPLLKSISVITVLSNLFIQSDLLAAAFLLQAFHTTAFCYFLVRKLEKSLDYFRKEVSPQ